MNREQSARYGCYYILRSRVSSRLFPLAFSEQAVLFVSVHKSPRTRPIPLGLRRCRRARAYLAVYIAAVCLMAKLWVSRQKGGILASSGSKVDETDVDFPSGQPPELKYPKM